MEELFHHDPQKAGTRGHDPHPQNTPKGRGLAGAGSAGTGEARRNFLKPLCPFCLCGGLFFVLFN